jgi:D-arabinose 1-dehydrogenase-like Zn-dependent alcohol dehydrogenase
VRAVVIDSFQGRPSVQQVADPTPAPGGVVIEVVATGLCRSDWHGWMGHDADIALPHVPGHELAGIVAAVGSGVRDWRVGDRVTTPFVCACGSCEPCLAGENQVCVNQFQPGFTHWGSFAEYVAIHRADLNLVGLPAGLDFASAALLGCRFSTAYRALTAVGLLQPGEWLAVHGCGGVGLAAVMIGHALGARVVAVDVTAKALDVARSFGADVTMTAEGDVRAAVREATGGGAHVSVDAFGSAMTAANSVLSLRTRGRHVQIGLLLTDDGNTPIPMSAVISRELQLLGSHGMAAPAFVPMLHDIAAGRLDPSRIIGDTISLEEVPDALMAMSTGVGNGGATIIDPKRVT